MKPRTTLLLVVLAVIVGVGGWWFGQAGQPREQVIGEGRLMFPDLAPKLQDATQVSIQQGGKSLTLDRDGTVWRIAEKSGYPAKPDKLHALLAGMADIRLLEPRTSDPSEYAALGVGDPQGDKDATLVRVSGKGQAIAQMIVGHRRTLPNAAAGSGDQVYVRAPDAAQSWLAQGRIEPSTDPAGWMGEDLTDIKAARVADVMVTHPDGSLGFAMKDGKLTMTQPAEHPALDPDKLKDVAQAFEYLIFMDVAKAAAQPGQVVGDSTFHTKDGLTLTAHVTKDGDKTWAHFAAQGTDKAADEAKKLSALFDGWAYQIGNWKLAALAPTMDELKAPPPKPAAQAAPEGAAPAAAPVTGPVTVPAPEAAH